MLDKAIRWVPFFAIMFFSYLMVRLTIPYFSFRTDVDFLLTKQGIIHNKLWLAAFYTHISTSTFVLIFGASQFIRPITVKYKAIHRSLGKAYIILVLFFSGPSGLIMGYYGNGGVPAEISFMIQALLWILFTYMAYFYIRKMDIRMHTRFMILSYALTLAAISLRAYAYLFPYFPSFISNLKGKDEYIFLAWTSWIPNLIVALILIKKGFMARLV